MAHRRSSFRWCLLPIFGRPWGLPGSWHLSSCVPRSLTPAGPRGSHHERSLCVGFRNTNTVSTCANEVTRLNCLGECGLPCGPQDALCTLRVHCSVIQGVAQSSQPLLEGGASICLTTSFAYATLDRGGWLGLTPRGLSPRQKCQAFLAH
jgi:hypothetical protein